MSTFTTHTFLLPMQVTHPGLTGVVDEVDVYSGYEEFDKENYLFRCLPSPPVPSIIVTPPSDIYHQSYVAASGRIPPQDFSLLSTRQKWASRSQSHIAAGHQSDVKAKPLVVEEETARATKDHLQMLVQHAWKRNAHTWDRLVREDRWEEDDDEECDSDDDVPDMCYDSDDDSDSDDEDEDAVVDWMVQGKGEKESRQIPAIILDFSVIQDGRLAEDVRLDGPLLHTHWLGNQRECTVAVEAIEKTTVEANADADEDDEMEWEQFEESVIAMGRAHVANANKRRGLVAGLGSLMMGVAKWLVGI